MARHDREESLEEQLAWLDAIKEQEEAPPIALKSTAVDDAIISPYPKDPWSLVPAEPETASSSLFRTAADPSHDFTGGSTSVTDPLAEDADAAEWMEASGPTSAFIVPPATSSPAQDNDGFLAPLKPLPRHEVDDTAGYTAAEPMDSRGGGEPSDGRTTGEYAGPEARTSHIEPEPERDPEQETEPARGLFEQPHRPADASETFPLINTGLRGPETSQGPEAPRGSVLPQASEASHVADLSQTSEASHGPGLSHGSEPSREPALEPFKPSAPGAEAFTFGGAASTAERFAPAGDDPDRDRLAHGDAAERDRDRFAHGGGEQDRDRFTHGGGEQDRDRSVFGSGEQDRDRFAPAEGDFGRDRPTSPGGALNRDRPVSVEDDPARDRFAPVEDDPARDRFAPVADEPSRDRFTSGGAAQDRGRSTPGGAGRDRDHSTSGSAGREPERSAFGTFEATRPPAATEPSQRTAGRAEPGSAESFRVPTGAFGADTPKPATPSEHSSPAGASGGVGTFGSAPSTAPGDAPLPASAPSQDRAHSSPDRPAREGRKDREASFTSERDTTFAPGPDKSFSEPPPVPERAPSRETAEPAQEPYQARRRHSAPPPAFSAPSRQASGSRPSADSLDPDSLLRGRRNAPSSGWRKLIYKASAGLIKPGESPETRRRRELITRARTPVATGHHRVAVLSLKGGVGKTTTTVGLGATLAQARGDRVIAVDANPDRGTLSDKVELETSATVRDLLNERQQIKRYVDIRAFTSQAPSRLEILASDRDPSVSEAFSASDYQSVAQVLENFYSICITDCGTGLLHSAMSGVLGLADQLVLVSSPSVDGARAASATLDWLEAHHYEELVRSATVVLCSVRPRSKSTVDLDRLEAHFAARCRAVVRIPYDPHLEEGAEIELDRLQPATRDSYLRLAASVGDGFAGLQS